MTVLDISITIDCADPASLASFWEAALGYERRPHAPDSVYVTLERPAGVEGLSHVTFQRVAEPKAQKLRAHLDLHVDAAEPLVAKLVGLGAELGSVQEAGQWTTRVLQDPAGNEFCVIGPD